MNNRPRYWEHQIWCQENELVTWVKGVQFKELEAGAILFDKSSIEDLICPGI